MIGPSIRIDSCKGCGLCIASCPRQVLAFSERINARGVRYAVARSAENCADCGTCYLMCPDAAIEVLELAPLARTG
ncbi:MAG: ferredoxin family protein [Candidatus Glassbacteria bacterium]|nr:ferredoxin family protein [Candidatus Glassbacteria bacterium]